LLTHILNIKPGDAPFNARSQYIGNKLTVVFA
jgi:hypothetical protein